MADGFTWTVHPDSSALTVYFDDQTTSSPLSSFIWQSGGPLVGGVAVVPRSFRFAAPTVWMTAKGSE